MTSKWCQKCSPLQVIGIVCILCTPWPIYPSSYQLTLDQCIGRHIGWVSTDMSANISVECRLLCQPRCAGRHINRHRLIVMSAGTQLILYRHLSETLLTLGQHYAHLIGSCYWVLSSLVLRYWISHIPLRGSFSGCGSFLTFHAGNIHLSLRLFSKWRTFQLYPPSINLRA